MTQLSQYRAELDAFDETYEGWAIDLQLDLAKLMVAGLRKNPQWTQRQLARLAELTDAQISTLVRGEERNCKLVTLCKALHPFGGEFRPALVLRSSIRNQAAQNPMAPAYLEQPAQIPLTGTDHHASYFTTTPRKERHVITTKGGITSAEG